MHTFDADDGQAALAEYFPACFAVLEDDETSELPDPAPILGAFAGDGHLHTAVEITDQDVEPQRLLCPGGGPGECWRERRERNGAWVWVVVCNCH
jgi:hypothetical protein